MLLILFSLPFRVHICEQVLNHKNERCESSQSYINSKLPTTSYFIFLTYRKSLLISVWKVKTSQRPHVWTGITSYILKMGAVCIARSITHVINLMYSHPTGNKFTFLTMDRFSVRAIIDLLPHYRVAGTQNLKAMENIRF